jgi:hypothetical protein
MTSDDAYVERVETFFDYMFGDGAIPVRSFDDDQTELAFLDDGGLYGTMGECSTHGGVAPFVITLGWHDELVWRATCMECWAQIRVPASENDHGWMLYEDDAEVVVLDPVPDYETTTMPQPDTSDDAEAPTDE